MKTLLCVLIFFGSSLYCFAQQDSCYKHIMYNGNIFTVTSGYEISTIFTDGILDTLSVECNNSEAVDRFRQYIEMMKYFNANGVSEIDGFYSIEEGLIWQHMRDNFVYLLSNDIGRKAPQYSFSKTYFNDDELKLCEEWLIKHKDKICWYEEKNILYVKNK